METIKRYLFGGIYSDTYEEFADGGPTCFNETTVQFRLLVSLFSATILCITIYLTVPTIRKSKELDLTLVKNLNPSLFEKIIGYISISIFLVMFYYKINSQRLVFMLNPCHLHLLMQGILLVTKKTKFNACMFISCLRWTYGPCAAFVFPDTNGFLQFMEIEFFYIEHFFGAFVGQAVLILSGRYGFFNESLWTLFQHQMFGFAFNSLYQRLINTPVSILTWANLNFVLCHPKNDPFYPIIGKYYLYFVDHYLNFASIVTLILFSVEVFLLKYLLVAPYNFITNKICKKHSPNKQQQQLNSNKQKQK